LNGFLFDKVEVGCGCLGVFLVCVDVLLLLKHTMAEELSFEVGFFDCGKLSEIDEL
jgi:hypothetical protein